jgi:hypothetical protein
MQETLASDSTWFTDEPRTKATNSSTVMSYHDNTNTKHLLTLRPGTIT